MFTRQSYTTPLKSKEAGATTEAVKRLFQQADAKPRILTSDDGTEFNGLHRLAEDQRFVYKRKLKDDVDAIAVNDRAMGDIKLNLKRRALRGEGQWPQNLAKATQAKNETLNEAVHGAPADVEKGGVQEFLVYQDNAAKLANNNRQNRMMTDRVLQRGWCRPAMPISDKLNRRISTIRYGEPQELYGLRAGILTNREGREAMLKQALITGPPGEREVRRPPTARLLPRGAPVAFGTRSRVRAQAPPAAPPAAAADPAAAEPAARPRQRLRVAL